MVFPRAVGALAAALDLVLPQTCAVCGLTGGPICAPCRQELSGLALDDLGLLAPSPVPTCWPGCTGTLRYEGRSAALMKAFKDGGRRDLVDPLGGLLADAAGRAICLPPFVRTEPVVLVPIPSSPLAIRRRGDRPMLLLAQRAAAVLGPRVVTVPVLGMARGTKDQAGLGRRARQANLQAAMWVTRPAEVRGRQCLLVDDVLTSGATLGEGRRALLAAGAAGVGMAVCMVTPRRVSECVLPFRSPADYRGVMGPSSDRLTGTHQGPPAFAGGSPRRPHSRDGR